MHRDTILCIRYGNIWSTMQIEYSKKMCKKFLYATVRGIRKSRSRDKIKKSSLETGLPPVSCIFLFWSTSEQHELTWKRNNI